MSADDHVSEEEAERAGTQRVDKWLWFARVAKSRTLAAQLVLDGKVRINRVKTAKPSHVVRRGDVLTLAVRGRVQLLRVCEIGRRRGPASEAQLLYQQITQPNAKPSPQAGDPSTNPSAATEGRPSPRDRRLARRLNGRR